MMIPTNPIACVYFAIIWKCLPLKVEIIRKATKPTCRFTDHFSNFENVEAVQRIFGDRTQDVLANFPIEFTNATLYMRVDHDGRLLINPHYLRSGDFTDIYLDVIHELVHVQQVLNGKNCNHQLKYVERPLEIQAYRTAVDEAIALGLDDNRILDYLDSDLVNEEELRLLAQALEVKPELSLSASTGKSRGG
jgi:hypothetical protein